MTATLLAIFLPIGYLIGTVLCGRITYDRMTHYPAGKVDYDDAVMAFFMGLFWPVLALAVGPVLVITSKHRQQIRAEEAKYRTAALEREIYGRTLS